ncbi:MAG: hypothetical protein E7Z87_01320 [Cyanobacteria bacterium SIG26]|nr:hypothetical protein [Cyanobacteria bacterium SIG26]
MEENKIELRKSIYIGILVFLGILVTIDLAYIYYQANFNSLALPSFCSVSDFVDCDGVAKTTESQFFGVPLAYWGLFLYSFIIILLFVDKLKQIKFLKFLEVFKNKFHYIASLGIISFIISMTLLCVSLFGIHKICVMCMVTYVLNLAIGLIAAHGIKGHFIGAIKQSLQDFTDALKPLPYRIAFSIVMLLACGFLGWTYTSAKFSPALNFKREYGEFAKMKTNKFAIKGNILGAETKDAVVLHIYSDYLCPMCRAGNNMLHKVVTEFKNVRVEHHSLPLDMGCNKYMTQPFHNGSCILAQYAEAAHIQGKFWEVNSLFFDTKNKPINDDDIIQLLKDADFGLDLDKLRNDAYSKEVIDKINADIDYAVANKQIGTPTMQMNGEFHMGVKGYTKLKKWVTEHGGQPKGLFQ